MNPKTLRKINYLAMIYLCIISLAATHIVYETYTENGLIWEETVTVNGVSSSRTRHIYQEVIGLSMFIGLFLVSCLNTEHLR